MDKPFTLNDVIRFARNRHRIWQGKQVQDTILTYRKFTNVFRVLDRGSQYLIELMNLYDDPLDRLALSYFYRQVNSPYTMDDIIAANDGYVPQAADIFSPSWYDQVVQPVVQARPGQFLNGAYIILIKPGDSRDTIAKMQEMFPAARPHLADVAVTTELEQRVALLCKTPGLGPFLAMQIATDMGYCAGEPDQENDFVLAGPGSRNGVKLISDKPAEQVITSFPVHKLHSLPGSNGRHASWMDVQNVFCEFSKWGRLQLKGYQGAAAPYQRNGNFEVSIPKHFIQ